MVLLVVTIFNFVLVVQASPEPGWLTGWSYRKSHVINPATGAGTNYQVKINALYSSAEEKIVPFSKLVSTLPTPSGTTIKSAQAAVYWDGNYLHVWYGSTTADTPLTDDIYYTKTSDFTNWNTPVKVIDRTDGGIRDPTVFVEGNYIYLFCQCFDGTNHRPIRLYKILKTADFTQSGNYAYVGSPIDVGSSGQFDDLWVASACVVKIETTYWMAYEAKKSTGVFSIGRAYASSIEGSWTKDGQMTDSNGNVIYNPYGQTVEAIVPDTFPDTDTLFLHIGDGSGGWYERYMNGDIPNNSMTLSSENIKPQDSAYTKHCNVAHIGNINGLYIFLMQTWTSTVYLRLYRQSEETIALNEHCKPDFGDIRFTADDGEIELDYWMESKVDSSYAVFWVEVADDLSSQAQTIYVYYGKSDAATTSNGDNTFLFFDHFLGSSLNTSKWVVRQGDISVLNSELTLTGTAGTQGLIDGLTNVGINAALHVRVKWSATTANSHHFCTFRSSGSWNDRAGDLWGTSAANQVRFQTYSGGNGGDPTVSVSTPTDYHIYKVTWKSGESKAYQNDTLLATRTTYIPTVNMVVAFYEGTTSGQNVLCDWVFVRKWVDPEPSHGSWGSEAQLYIADLSQSIGSTWNLLTQTNFNVVPSQSLITSWNILTQSVFNVIPTLSLTTSCVVHTVAEISYATKRFVLTAIMIAAFIVLSIIVITLRRR